MTTPASPAPARTPLASVTAGGRTFLGLAAEHPADTAAETAAVVRAADDLLLRASRDAPDVEVLGELGILSRWGPRLRVEVRDRRDGAVRVVVVSDELDADASAYLPFVPHPGHDTGSTVRRLRDGVGVAEERHETASNADYARLVRGVVASPPSTLDLVHERLGGRGRPGEALRDALLLAEVHRRWVGAAATLVEGLASGAPPDWVLRRAVDEDRWSA